MFPSRAGRWSDRRGRGSRASFFPARERTRTIPTALGQVISTKNIDEIDIKSSVGRAEITGVRPVASYNLLEGLSKTIIVPGRPPIWTPSEDAVINPDDGTYYRDENAVRFPKHTMDPAVASILHFNPAFMTSTIDVFGCGSTLGDLLRFCCGKPQPFTFTVHVIGKSTVFFVRRNQSPDEIIENVYGYGHSYPEANTTWPSTVKKSHSNQRIIQYLFGGLQFLVRFEADGYILDQGEDLADELLGSDKSANVSTHLLDQALPESLDDIFAVNITPEKPSENEADTEEPTIRTKGSLVPQSTIFDLKTRSAFKKHDEIFLEQLPRLWIRQIPNFILAIHNKGRFGSPEVQDINGDLENWERTSTAQLEKMAGLIRYIREIALSTPDRKLEVRGDQSSILQICEISAAERENWEPLSARIQARWT